MKFFLSVERLKNKLLRFYRKKVLEDYINQKTENCRVLGKMILINRNVKIGKNVTIYPNVMLFGDGPIVIGNNVDIGNNTIIYSSAIKGGVTIGNNTIIAANCYIIDINHGTKLGELIRNQENDCAPINIGEDCWIAENVTVLKGSIIGDGAVIGAKALVNSEIPPNAIAVGIPAKVKKNRG